MKMSFLDSKFWRISLLWNHFPDREQGYQLQEVVLTVCMSDYNQTLGGSCEQKETTEQVTLLDINQHLQVLQALLLTHHVELHLSKISWKRGIGAVDIAQGEKHVAGMCKALGKADVRSVSQGISRSLSFLIGASFYLYSCLVVSHYTCPRQFMGYVSPY